MTVSQYAVLVALIFALGAAVQLGISAAMPVIIGETRAPVWATSIAFGVAIMLAWLGYSTLR
jgi:hypothetical protein